MYLRSNNSIRDFEFTFFECLHYTMTSILNGILLMWLYSIFRNLPTTETFYNKNVLPAERQMCVCVVARSISLDS